MNLKYIIKKILHLYYNVNHDADWESFVTPSARLGQDVRYAIDDTKLKKIGWQPLANFDHELELIVDYYRNNFVW